MVGLTQFRKALIKIHELMEKFKTKSNRKYKTAVIKQKDFNYSRYKATQFIYEADNSASVLLKNMNMIRVAYDLVKINELKIN